MRTLISATPEATHTAITTTTTTTPAAATRETTAAPHYALSLAPVTRRRAARAYTTVARILLGGLALQIFFAGTGIFTASGFVPHIILGPLVILGSLALPLIAWRGHLGASLIHRSWLIFALMILQGLLIDAGRLVHLAAAFHPLNAMLLVLLVASVARIGGSR